MGGWPSASLEKWRAQCFAMGLIEQDKAHTARTLFARHKLRLITANWIQCNQELAWILP